MSSHTRPSLTRRSALSAPFLLSAIPLTMASSAGAAVGQPLDVLYYRAQQISNALKDVQSTRMRLEETYPGHTHAYMLYDQGLDTQQFDGRLVPLLVVSGRTTFRATTAAAEPGYIGAPSQNIVLPPTDQSSRQNLAILMIAMIQFANGEGQALSQLLSLYQVHSHNCFRNTSVAVRVSQPGGGAVNLATPVMSDQANGYRQAVQTGQPLNAAASAQPFQIPMQFKVGDIVTPPLFEDKNASGVMGWIEARVTALQVATHALQQNFAQHTHRITTDDYDQISLHLNNNPYTPRVYANARDKQEATSVAIVNWSAPAPAPRIDR